MIADTVKEAVIEVLITTVRTLAFILNEKGTHNRFISRDVDMLSVIWRCIVITVLRADHRRARSEAGWLPFLLGVFC